MNNFSGIDPSMVNSGYFESNPQSLWAARMPTTGSSNFRDWYKNRFSQAYNYDYTNAMSRKPQMSWWEFNLGYNPWQDYMKQSPTQRGVYTGKYAPTAYFNLSRT